MLVAELRKSGQDSKSGLTTEGTEGTEEKAEKTQGNFGPRWEFNLAGTRPDLFDYSSLCPFPLCPLWLILFCRRNSSPARVVFFQMTPRQLGDLIDRLGPALVLALAQWAAAPEDVVQDAFLKLVEARRLPDDPAAWLFAVVRNRAMDLAKADRRRAKRRAGGPAGRVVRRAGDRRAGRRPGGRPPWSGCRPSCGKRSWPACGAG